MKRMRKVSFLVLSLAFLVAIPAVVLAQTAPAGGGTTGDKPTPVPTLDPVPTATPVVGSCGGDRDKDGGFGSFDFKVDWDGHRHHRHSDLGDHKDCDRD